MGLGLGFLNQALGLGFRFGALAALGFGFRGLLDLMVGGSGLEVPALGAQGQKPRAGLCIRKAHARMNPGYVHI